MVWLVVVYPWTQSIPAPIPNENERPLKVSYSSSKIASAPIEKTSKCPRTLWLFAIDVGLNIIKPHNVQQKRHRLRCQDSLWLNCNYMYHSCRPDHTVYPKIYHFQYSPDLILVQVFFRNYLLLVLLPVLFVFIL